MILAGSDFVTIQELAHMMSSDGQAGSDDGIAKRAWRAYKGGAFPNARKTAPSTGTIIIPAVEAKAWIAAGCPTPGQLAASQEEQQADKHDRIKRAWHLEEGRLADVAGLDR